MESGSLGGGGGVSCGGSTAGSMSTASKEDNLTLLSSEVSSSSSPDESELELGLGLSLGCSGGAAPVKTSKPGCSWRVQGRILTAQDFPRVVSKASLSSASSSSSPNKPNNASCGTKRSADSFSPPRCKVSQVVGWPPVGNHRINSLVNQTKLPTSEDCNSTIEKNKAKIIVPDNINHSMNSNKNDSKANLLPKTTLYVKVNMDGVPIGRKVDLNAHSSYKTLAQTLDDMFCSPGTTVSGRSEYSFTTPPCGSTFGGLKIFWEAIRDIPWLISSAKVFHNFYPLQFIHDD